MARAHITTVAMVTIFASLGPSCASSRASREAPAMSVQVFALLDLTSGLTGGGFQPELVDRDDVLDEDNPLFPDDEEPDDPSDAEVAVLLCRIRRATGGRRAWRSPAWIRRQGSVTLVARNTSEVLARMGEVIDVWVQERVAAEGR